MADESKIKKLIDEIKKMIGNIRSKEDRLEIEVRNKIDGVKAKKVLLEIENLDNDNQ